MINGYLLQLGHRIPRSRLEASYLRVIGPPSATFGARRIQRRVYNVAGPMALMHHDGQHGEHTARQYEQIVHIVPGLIRWRVVIHAFVDGYSRFVLGIRASNNNRAQTVLQLFEDITDVHGYPSRVRGDHGTENLLVAARMEEVRGIEHGSYIWGRYACPNLDAIETIGDSDIYRSVHNIRIKRLWVDVMNGLGLKWKEFFQTLEASDGLDANNSAHLWLLHKIFLPMINEEAEQWAAAWNHHIISRTGEHHLSPHALFLQGTIERGQRSLFLVEEDIGNIEEYGVDWHDLDNQRIRAHHDVNNPNEADQPDHSPFILNHPEQLSHVEVPDTSSPFANQLQDEEFHRHLQPILDRTHANMQSRRLLWIESLTIAQDMYR